MNTAVKNETLSILLADLKAKLIELYGDRLFSLILFGSQARGEATSDSDIDVMVILNGSVDIAKEIYRMSAIRSYFLMHYDELVSILPVSKEEYLSRASSFIRVVGREGIVL